MIYHIVEERKPNFTTNCLHISDEHGSPIATIWEIQGLGQDELWHRAGDIVDYLNFREKIFD